jgi:hypothetical protein
VPTLDDLAAEPVWVAWRNEDRAGKSTKVPYSASGAHARADDPTTWDTRRAAEARARRIVNGLGGGIGVILGIDCRDDTALGGIDLDTCRSPEGEIEAWALDVIRCFDSYSETSPSQSGVKVFFRYRAADLARLRQIMGTDHGRMFKRAGGDHPPAIELHISNRYFTVTGDALGSAELRLVELADLEWLLTEAGPAFCGGKPRGPKVNGFTRGDGGPRDRSRSAAAFRLAVKMRRAGADFDAFREAVRTDPEAADWYREKGAPNDERELKRAWENAGEAGDEGVRLEDFRAFMPTHSYLFAPSGDMWPGSSVNARVAPVVLLDGNGKPALDDKGDPVKVAASRWLDANRAVEQLSWAPGEPQVIEGRLVSHAGWIERPGVSVFNLYKGPTIFHGDAGAAKPWLRHIRRVFPGEHHHILLWLAHRVQKPQDKINHGLVLGGAQGVGKDSLLEPVKHAVGPWNWAEISPVALTGSFNGFVKSVVLRVSEGHDLGEIDRFQFYEHSKVYTAAPPDVLRVNEKFLREYYVANVCGLIITTNHKANGIYLPADDRRHFVAWSNATKENFEPDYWTKLWEWYRDGGFGHVAAHLAELDISTFDPKAPPPKTDAWWAIVDAGRSPEDADLANALDKLNNPDALVLGDLLRVAPSAFEDWLRDRKNRRAVPHRLEACGYGPVRNPDAANGLWRIDGEKVVAYARSTLTVREQIEAVRHRRKERP